MLSNVFKKKSETNTATVFQAFLMGNNSANWTGNTYEQFCNEGYIKNVVAYRCIAMVARSASFVNIECGIKNNLGIFIKDPNHFINSLLQMPNVYESYYDLMEKIYSYKLIWGNAFLRISLKHDNSYKLECLRPDRVTILSGEDGEVVGYRYKHKKITENYYMNENGFCEIIHIKSFNPMNDFYGLSAMESAKYSIDQHNEASKYTKSLLQNSARPSGALVVKANEYNNGGRLTDEQFEKLKSQLFSAHTGSQNNGKPLILEGGLEWKEMSISPKDMDFIETKHSAAREIALAFGVPPQLIGIPGDNTYSNMAEARLALWEQTIIPLIQDVTKTLERGFRNFIQNNDIDVDFDRSQIAQVSKKII